jgi:hypothetical protein
MMTKIPMPDTPASFPIPYHPTWNVRDPSKMKDFHSCPRQFFYSHILGWRLDSPEIDLIFGEAWHEAMEYLLLHDYSTGSMMAAIDAFMKVWRREFDPEMDDLHASKNPDGVLNALPAYCAQYQNDQKEFEVLYTEVAGSVPISEDRVLFFRMDSVLRNLEKGYIYSLDHKTTGRFSWMWDRNFMLALQNFTYTHCLHCMYPDQEVKGLEYNGAGFEFLKTKGHRATFKRVPAWKTPDQMNVWLWEINDLCNNLDYEFERLASCKESDDVLMAFPRNEESCTKYRGCKFHDFCMAWSNPLQHCFEAPLGYKIEFWDPTEKEATNKMDLKF